MTGEWTLTSPDKTAEPGWARALAGLVLLALAVTAVMLVTDLMLYARGIAVDRLFRPKTLLTLFGVVALVAAMPSRRTRIGVLIFFIVNQIIWTGVGVYYARALGPEQLLLAQHEVGDTVRGALAEWRSLVPPILVVAGLGVVAGALLWRDWGGRVLRWRHAPVALAVAVTAASAFWFLHKRIEVAFPGADTPSAYGPLQAAVSVLRLQSTKVSAGEGVVIADQTVKAVPVDASEPQTIVVIMGESINPYRMSVLGFGRETTPGMEAWLKTPPAGFTFIPRIGVSGGTATFGSVPTFLRMAYIPVGGEAKGMNLFDIASKQKFKSYFFSVQHPQFLDMAGGAKAAEVVETIPGRLDARFAEIHDDLLFEHARSLKPEDGNRFVFFHQNVNHSGYTQHCPHLPDSAGMYVFKDQAGTHEGRRQADYDNGMRCWDRNVTGIVDALRSIKGAVHILIMGDHNELMGELGLWGHGFPDLHVSVVPMMLLTNRPQSPVAEMFRKAEPPTTYRMAQMVARAMGLEVSTPGVSPARFYLNSTMPFGLAGFTEVERLGNAKYKVTFFARNGRPMKTKVEDMTELETGRVPGPATANVAKPAAPMP